MKRQNRSFNDFIYSDEITEDCNELEMPLVMLIVMGALFIIVIIVAGLAIIQRLDLKKDIINCWMREKRRKQ